MLNNKLFISSIPPVLSKDELYDYIKKAHNGDLEARKTVVEHNIGIVLYHVSKKFATAPYDLKELASVGLIGLIKSVDNFNFEKNTNFNTYALNCINNEILMFIKRNKRTLNNMSLDDKLKNKKSNDEFIIGDVLENKSSDFVLDYETQEVYKTIRKVVKSLPYKDNRIITYYFGFENNKRYIQNEIAEKLGISQPTVSILLKNILKKIKSELIKLDIIEKNKPTIVKKNVEKQKTRKTKSFYDYFDNYKEEEIDKAILELSEDEKELIHFRYGEDLTNTPCNFFVNKNQIDKFYGIIIPKIKTLLIKLREKKINLSEVSEYFDDDDDKKIVDLIKTEKFNKLLKYLSFTEALIVYLRLGYVNNKSFSTKAIADFLTLEEKDVIEIIKKIQILIKENFNMIFENNVMIPKDYQYIIKKKDN